MTEEIRSKNPRITVENVSKVFGPRAERAIPLLDQGHDRSRIQADLDLVVGVHDVSLDIATGEIFVLMGLSGSGKSTLLRLLNGLHTPSRGRICVDGTDLGTLPRASLLAFRRSHFGMIFQKFALLPHRTVLGNVEFGLELRGMARELRREKARAALELVGLGDWQERYPNALSGGMQQRVGLARALCIDPDILLMDEAFSALDPLIRSEMQDELLALQARMRKTIVFVTHDLDEALKLGDRIAILRDGRLVQVGTAEEILTRPADDYVAAFTRGIDRSRLLRAADIAEPAAEIARPEETPAEVLEKLQRSGLSSIFVVDEKQCLQGRLRLDTVRDCVADGHSLADPNGLEGVPAVRSSAPLAEVIAAAAKAGTPLAVVDGARRFRGVIRQKALFAALAGPQSRPAKRPAQEHP